MKIAVIGAGFCGLACAWHAASSLKAKVILFDKQGIGAGASGLTAGLIHPYAGPRAQASWMAEVAMQETIKLLSIAAPNSYRQSGILRPEVAGMDFSEAKNHPDVEWWDAALCQKHIPELAPLPGLFIRSGITVNCPAYLQGLWQACQKLGCTFEQATIQAPSDISGYDYIIFTVGAGLSSLHDIMHPPVSLIKGQTLELEWQNKPPLPFAVNAGVQFSQIEQGSVWAGATYERRWKQEGPDAEAASSIREKIALFAPEFATLKLKKIWSSFRAATNDKRPFITHTAPNIYCLGGMGSKGLLYHAWMAKQVISSILANRNE